MIKVIDLMSQITKILYTVGMGDIIFFFNFREIQLKFKIRLQKVHCHCVGIFDSKRSNV